MSTITIRSTLHIPEACRGTTRAKWRVLTLKHRVVAAPMNSAEVIPRFIPVFLAQPRRAQVQMVSLASSSTARTTSVAPH